MDIEELVDEVNPENVSVQFFAYKIIDQIRLFTFHLVWDITLV